MKQNHLTLDDQIFIFDLSAHTRASMQFSILQSPPQENDLIYISGEQMPYFLPLNTCKTFITLREILTLCESKAERSMIYEEWVRDVFVNIRAAARAMSISDGARLIAYYKSCHGIDDVAAIDNAANEAIAEARAALYGDLSDDEYDYFD